MISLKYTLYIPGIIRIYLIKINLTSISESRSAIVLKNELAGRLSIVWETTWKTNNIRKLLINLYLETTNGKKFWNIISILKSLRWCSAFTWLHEEYWQGKDVCPLVYLVTWRVWTRKGCLPPGLPGYMKSMGKERMSAPWFTWLHEEYG